MTASHLSNARSWDLTVRWNTGKPKTKPAAW